MNKYNEVAILLINELKKYNNAEEMNRFLNEYKNFEPEWNDIENYLIKYYPYYFYCTISNGIVGVIYERIKGNF